MYHYLGCDDTAIAEHSGARYCRGIYSCDVHVRTCKSCRNVDHVWKYMYLASCLSFISHEHGARFSTLTSACGLQDLQSYTDSPTVSAVDFILQLLHILQAMQSWAGPGNKIAPGAFRVCRARAATCGVEQWAVNISAPHSNSHYTHKHVAICTYVYSTYDARCWYGVLLTRVVMWWNYISWYMYVICHNRHCNIHVQLYAVIV